MFLFLRSAENNPANDYPDEELSSSDEDDDPSAMLAKIDPVVPPDLHDVLGRDPVPASAA